GTVGLVATVGGVEDTTTVRIAPITFTQTLENDDTSLTVCVADNRMFITSLRNPRQGWDWVSGIPPAPMPLPSLYGKTVVWQYVGQELDTSNGTRLTLRFTSASPNMELQSIWRARPGVGPVEHRVDIVNKTAGVVTFTGNGIVAANLNLIADKPVQFFPLDAGNVGGGEKTPLPYQIVKVGSAHGIYFAYDYGCGQYQATRDPANPLRVNCRFWVGNGTNPYPVTTYIAAGETFHLPGIMIQTYQGDEDDAANRFRKWFWNYEITPSLRNNPKEPPIEYCADADRDGDPAFLLNFIKTNDLASWGIGCLKTDAWHWETKHAKSDEIAAALHAKGIKLSMYFNGPSMVAKPDDQVALTILLDEAKKSKFDYYRSDTFTGPAYVDLGNYHSVESFKRRLDTLAKAGVGWENCANGGNVRSLDVCRRMTFMTHSDSSGLIPFFVHVYHWSYMMPPIQLKSDYGIGFAMGGDDIATIRGYLLGAILGGPKLGGKEGWNRIEDIKKVWHLYNAKQRPILRGADVYRILPPPAADVAVELAIAGRADGYRILPPARISGSAFSTTTPSSTRVLYYSGKTAARPRRSSS
ncbi:hypothetical protein ACFLQU_05735, partial [Verrucomicrobiota bacterium]